MSLSMEPGDFFLLGKAVAKDGEENLNQQSLDPTTFLLCGPDWRMSVTLLMQLACTMKKQDDTCWIITTRLVDMYCVFLRGMGMCTRYNKMHVFLRLCLYS